MSDEMFSAYTAKELRLLAKTFNSMGENAIAKAKTISFELANFAKEKITAAGHSRTKSGKAVARVVDGASISRTSKTGRLSYGFAGQRFSGGGTTQILWRGLEFGSNKFKQFPAYSGRFGRGSRGWFIYPTLRDIQPELTKQWTVAMSDVIKEWNQ